jgi:hypothetical protein
VQIKAANPLYGDSPYTVLNGGGTCGQRGQYIHVTPEYIMNVDGASADTYGSPGNIFLHEWTKFRCIYPFHSTYFTPTSILAS